MDGRPPVGNLQRANTKRAVLIPQKTTLRFDGPPPDSGDTNTQNNGTDGVGLRKLSSNRLLSKPSSAHQRPTSSNNSLVDPLKINGEVFERFLESVPPIGLSREDSNIMRARVIEEMYRIQERANITPEERQRLFQLAMSMDAPRLARKLVAEAEEGREEGVGAFLTVSKLNNSSSSSVLSGVSSRDMMTGNPSIPSSSSSSSGHHNQIQRNTHSSQGHYSTSSSLSNSNTHQNNNHNNNNHNDDGSGSSGGGEDDAFCKAFDEVERIRQRILQRASGNTIGNAIPPTGKIPSNHHHSSSAVYNDSNSHMITLPRENSATSSEHSRRSSYELHPIHEFTLTDLPAGEGEVEHKDTILSPEKENKRSHQVMMMDEKPGEDEGKEGNEANIIHSLDMLIDNADDSIPLSSERKTVDLTAAHKGLLQLHDKLSQQPLTRTMQSEEDEEASAKERRDKFPSFSSQNVDYRNQQPLRGTLQSVDSSDSHLFQGIMENHHHNNSAGSYSSSQRDRHSINDSRDSSRSNWTVMLTQSSDDSHQPTPMSGKHTASVDSIHMNEDMIPSINGGQTSLPPLGMELRQAKALLLSPLTDWIRLGKQISHTPLSVPITPGTFGPPTVEEKGKTPLISPRQMIPPLSSKTHQSTTVGVAPLRRSKFSFEPFANSPDDDHSKGTNLHTTSTISTGSAASSQLSSCDKDGGSMLLREDSPEINVMLLNKVKHSLQLLGERISSPTNVNGSTGTFPPSLTNNYTALPAIDTKISPRSASATALTPLVSQSLSSVKMPAVQGALHLNRPTTMASSVSTSPTLSERSSSGAIRMAAELALTKQGSGRVMPLSRDTSSHSLYDQSFMNGQYNMIGTPNTGRQTTFHSQVAGGESVKTSRSNKLALAAALNAGDAVGKLMAEMLISQKK